jgi:hypothetical protein
MEDFPAEGVGMRVRAQRGGFANRSSDVQPWHWTASEIWP